MRIKWIFSGLAILAVLLILPAGEAEARLSVASPQGMIEWADLIITGTVAERDYEDEQRQVTIEIDQVLKGSTGEKRLQLTYMKDVIYGWTGFDFPEPGVKIMLLLGGSPEIGCWPAGDLNFVAVIQDGQVQELYHGSQIGSNDQLWTPQDYALAYDAFYQSHRLAENMDESGLITKEQIAAMIKTQGCHDMEYYYFDGLSYEAANLDDDADREILARIDGGVHLGQFFIFDEGSDGEYKLIAEKDWKVEEWDLNHPADIDGNMVFRLITRSGGTGADIYTTHLCYLHQNHFTEAWQGTMLERSVFGRAYFEKVCGYQIDLYSDNKRLYAWETTLGYQLEDDRVTPSGDIKTETFTRVYIFNGTEFIQQESE